MGNITPSFYDLGESYKSLHPFMNKYIPILLYSTNK